MPTPQELARQELARRELARRQQATAQSPSTPSINPADVRSYFQRRTEAGFGPAQQAVAGMAVEPIAGLAGIAQSVNPYAEQGAGAEAVGATREALMPTPSQATVEGMQGMAPLAEGYRAIEKGAGELGYQVGGPVGGAIGEALPTAASMLVRPANVARGVGRGAVKKAISRETPTGMYESAAKFSTTLPKETRAAMAETALKHKVMPTTKGLDKLSSLVDSFDTKITGLIDDATKAGKTIPKGAIYKHLKELRKKVGGTKVGAAKNLRQVNKAAKEMDLQLKALKKKDLTPQELQDIKTSAYSQVSYEAGKLRSQSGTEAATKAIAKGAKEAIESIADVKDLNRELGKLLELQKPLARSAARIENRDIVGIGAPIKITAGSAAGPAGAAAGTGLSLLEHPRIKAKLAIKLREIQNSGQLEMINKDLYPILVRYGLLQTAQSPSADVE